jgi:hypothetical protein
MTSGRIVSPLESLRPHRDISSSSMYDLWAYILWMHYYSWHKQSAIIFEVLSKCAHSIFSFTSIHGPFGDLLRDLQKNRISACGLAAKVYRYLQSSQRSLHVHVYLVNFPSGCSRIDIHVSTLSSYIVSRFHVLLDTNTTVTTHAIKCIVLGSN